MREDYYRKFSVGEWFRLKSLSTIRGVVYVVRIKYSEKPFSNAFSVVLSSLQPKQILQKLKGPETQTW